MTYKLLERFLDRYGAAGLRSFQKRCNDGAELASLAEEFTDEQFQLSVSGACRLRAVAFDYCWILKDGTVDALRFRMGVHQMMLDEFQILLKEDETRRSRLMYIPGELSK